MFCSKCLLIMCNKSVCTCIDNMHGSKTNDKHVFNMGINFFINVNINQYNLFNTLNHVISDIIYNIEINNMRNDLIVDKNKCEIDEYLNENCLNSIISNSSDENLQFLCKSSDSLFNLYDETLKFKNHYDDNIKINKSISCKIS